eukprot:gene29922-36136_t
MDRKDEKSSKSEADLDQVTGCALTWDDEPAVVASFACFAAYIVYGASASSLGAALPSLAEHFDRSKAGFGLAFTIRGIGYFMGTLASAWILSLKRIPTKEMMTCIALLFTGVTQGIISSTDNFSLAMVCFFIQGVGFGGIDTMANCVLPEVWGRRVQPWMQALHSFFGIGAILGPAFVGAINYHTAFVIIMVASFAPLIGLVSYKLIKNPPCVATNQHAPLVDEAATTAGGNSESAEVDTVKIAPYFLRFIVSMFFFLYVGVETGFAGWVPTYVLLEDVTDSNSKAAYLSSIFWAFLTLGRVLAVFTALLISATTMIRLQLGMIMVICVLALFLLNINYTITAAVCGLLGFSLSSVFPVMMTLFGDYGFAMDPTTTSMFMIGATFGESIVPVFMGWMMELTSPAAIPVMTFLCGLMLLLIYLYVHYRSSQLMRENKSIGSGSNKADWGSRSQHALLQEGSMEYNPVNTNVTEGEDADEGDVIELTQINYDDEVTV